VTACLNCGELVAQRFCPACGQEVAPTLQRPFREIAGEVLDETIALDSRFGHTLLPLLTRPGFLTAEYLAGRRARYTSPLKLYLLFSFLFFVAAALTPRTAFQISAREEKGDKVQVQGSLAGLRAKGRLGARVADRLDALRALPRAQLQERLAGAFQDNAPRVVFFLVPVLALTLKLLYRRRYYAEHLVTALHAHAFAFAVLLPSELLPWGWPAQAGAALTGLWLVLALRRIYGQSWLRTVANGLLLLFTYAVALGLGLAGALFAVLFLL
jgi:hypothetical protein